jgi:hypothetical protein
MNERSAKIIPLFGETLAPEATDTSTALEINNILEVIHSLDGPNGQEFSRGIERQIVRIRDNSDTLENANEEILAWLKEVIGLHAALQVKLGIRSVRAAKQHDESTARFPELPHSD